MAVTTAKERKLRSGDTGKVNEIEYFVGSGNVYEDLGFHDAEERFAKLRLAAQVNEIIQKNGWTQKTAAATLGTQQPEISNLSRGRLRGITYDRLVAWLIKLGYSVEIKDPAIKETPRAGCNRVTVRMGDTIPRSANDLTRRPRQATAAANDANRSPGSGYRSCHVMAIGSSPSWLT